MDAYTYTKYYKLSNVTMPTAYSQAVRVLSLISAWALQLSPASPTPSPADIPSALYDTAGHFDFPSGHTLAQPSRDLCRPRARQKRHDQCSEAADMRKTR